MISVATSSTAVYNEVKCKTLHLLVYFKHPVAATSQHMMTSYSSKHIFPIVPVTTEVALATKLQGVWHCSSSPSLFLWTLPTCFGFCRYQAGRQRETSLLQNTKFGYLTCEKSFSTHPQEPHIQNFYRSLGHNFPTDCLHTSNHLRTVMPLSSRQSTHEQPKEKYSGRTGSLY